MTPLKNIWGYAPSIKLTLLVMLFAIPMACGPTDQIQEDPEEHTEGDTEIVFLTPDEIVEHGVTTAVAASGLLRSSTSFPGEVKVNEDQFAHIVPRIGGVVEQVNYSEGDEINKGDVLAILDSQELADIKSNFLADSERAEIARVNFEREKSLFEQEITSESEYLEARKNLSEADISLRSSRQKLLTLGFNEEYIASLPKQPAHSLVHFEIISPISGTILERKISQGEYIRGDYDAFEIANLSLVWVDLDIYQEDLDRVSEGQKVYVSSTQDRVNQEGSIRFVKPVIGEDTRTALARVVLQNKNSRWRPGMFITGNVTTEEVMIDVLVEATAIITFGGNDVIFVEQEGGYTPQVVTIGRQNSSHKEVLTGLKVGQKYVTSGVFSLKAELAKSELSEGHGH